jgi:prevent-host-death family protein
MAASVGIRELRQNLSRYIERVKAGETLAVTERGREVARLSPAGPKDSPVARLAAERGATLPTGRLADLLPPGDAPAAGPPSLEILDEMREERL